MASDSEDDFDLYEDGEDYILLDEEDDDPADSETDDDLADSETDDDLDADAGAGADEVVVPAAPAMPAAPSEPGEPRVETIRVIPAAERTMPARASLFEYAAMLATRARAIAAGSPALVKIEPGDSARDLARRELAQRLSPLRVQRQASVYNHETGVSEKIVEYWPASELELPL